MNVREKIYRQLALACEPFELGPWPSISAGVSSRRCPGSQSAIVEQLLDYYSESQLLSAGILTKQPNSFVLARELSDPANSFIFVAPTETLGCSYLYTAAGIVGEPDPPFVALTKMIRRQSHASHCAIFITFSLADALALQSVGLPSVTAEGLLHCPVADLDKVWQPFAPTNCVPMNPDEPINRTAGDLGEPDAADQIVETTEAIADEGAFAGPGLTMDAVEASCFEQLSAVAAEPEIEYVLVDWSPAQLMLSRPAGLLAVAKFLWNVERLGKRDLSNVSIWRPRVQVREELKFQLEYGRRDDIAAMLVENVGDSAKSLAGFAARMSRPKPPADYPAAASALFRLQIQRSPADDFEEERQTRISHQYKLLERDVINLLDRDAMVTNDPLQRNRLLAAAASCRIVLAQSPLIQEMIVKALRAGNVDPKIAQIVRSHIAAQRCLSAELKDLSR